MLSLVLRRTHMYLALFLTPWMLMYALSTMAMNHHQLLIELYGGRPPFEAERELDYDQPFAAGLSRQDAARQILDAADLDGRHRAQGDAAKRLTVLRLDPVSPRRLVYSADDQRVVIEKQEYRTPNLLARLHTRHGYGTDYAADDTWAFTVDLAIVAMLFWVLSGFWLWWEMKATRRLGTVAMLGGLGLFALFLVTI